MGEGSSSLVWLVAPGFWVPGIVEIDGEVVVEVETDSARVACPGCGMFGRAKDRRWVTLRDAPLVDRPVTTRCWKRVMECCEERCETRTWTAQRPEFALSRAVLTERAGWWATDRIAAVEATPTSAGRELGAVWCHVDLTRVLSFPMIARPRRVAGPR